MKKIKLTIILASMFFTTIAMANNPLVSSYSNIENTATGSKKEMISFRTDTNEPTKKAIYEYDLEGNIQEKTVYKWQGKNKGWVADQKLTYSYKNSNDKPESLTRTTWDPKANDWSNKSEVMNYNNFD